MALGAMSWTDLKRHRTSLLAVLATLVGLLAVDFFWLTTISTETEELRVEIGQQQELIQKLQKKLEQAQSIKDQIKAQENAVKKMQMHIFQGKDAYQLAASLGDLLATKDGPKLDIKTYQVLASKEYGLYQEVHIRFNFMTNTEGLYYFLDRIKNFETSILVQEINIQSVRRKSGPDLVINVVLAALLEKGP